MNDMDCWLVSFAIQWAAAKETLLIWVFKCLLERKIELIFASQEASIGGSFQRPMSVNRQRFCQGLGKTWQGWLCLSVW